MRRSRTKSTSPVAAGPPAVPRPEYPRPQLVRPDWTNLNGTWQLGDDPDDRGLAEGWERGRPLERRVVVPYPLESELSGAADREPAPVVWYRRELDWDPAGAGARTMLRIGASDYETQVFVNGRQVGAHRGGYDPIACAVGPALRPGRNEMVLRVADPPTWTRPRGKQAAGAARTPVDYDAVTGVWQTVWLEPLPEVSCDEVWTQWQGARAELRVNVSFSEPWPGALECALARDDEVVARERREALGRLEASLVLAVPTPRAWSPDDPFLYELRVRLLDGEREVDAVTQPVGLREIAVRDGALLLNGEPLYLRGVLDQGYFPGGWYAAATDADLRRDVELTRALGFNCARKHQKAEDPRWLYWADRLGLLVWAEMPSGRDFTGELVGDLVTQWMALVRRDRSHASVIAWVPFNESWGVWRQAERPEQRALVEGVAALTRALDPSRPVVGNDGWEYAAGDLFTLHVYEGEPGADADLAGRIAALAADPQGDVLPAGHLLGRRRAALPGADPSGLPILLTECGGVGFVPAGGERSAQLFSYGDLPADEAAFEQRLRDVMQAVGACDRLAGFVWTQLTDVQQEQNGLLGFDREPKLPLERLREIFGGKR
ncbi:MAG: glycoside hydrolase family 2 TIM barrel-domain containing protein [Myxococcota bacterium]|nr:glycoside hydrolase family 2 TIM barrel-domain containing protein [Myxococcota bacterium]